MKNDRFKLTQNRINLIYGLQIMSNASKRRAELGGKGFRKTRNAFSVNRMSWNGATILFSPFTAFSQASCVNPSGDVTGTNGWDHVTRTDSALKYKMAKSSCHCREQYLAQPPQFWIFSVAHSYYVTMLTISKDVSSWVPQGYIF